MDLTNNIINNNSTRRTPYAQTLSSSSQDKPFSLKSCSCCASATATDEHHHHQEMVVSYKECLKNHAANMGGHALDGCGEFMPSPTASPRDPTSLKCAACGCHRNFHRRDPYDGPTAYIYNLPPPPQPQPPHNPSSSPSPNQSPSPTRTPSSPVPCSYYSSAPQMLLALSSGYSNPAATTTNKAENPSGKKRSRTKFSQEQKEKMYAFAEKLGWKMPKYEDRVVEKFCSEVGVSRGVLKVWMHNHKHSFGKRELGVDAININNSNSNENSDDNGNGRVNFGTSPYNMNCSNGGDNEHHEDSIKQQLHASNTNGSSSSS